MISDCSQPYNYNTWFAEAYGGVLINFSGHTIANIVVNELQDSF